MRNFFLIYLLGLASILYLSGCATESYLTLTPATVNTEGVPFMGVKKKVAVGKFDNRSTYMQGLFSDGVDRLGGQSKTILITHLQQSGRFNVLDRANLEEIAKEAEYQGVAQSVRGADYVLTGQVTEFGRKVVGDRQLYGILGNSKVQVAYAKVSLNVVDVHTSDVVYSVQGAGEYALSSREVIGFGGRSGYDSTLNGKVLDLAIREAVNRLTEGVEQGALN
ncbi:MAG: curli biogenesis system outer membrane secretion channel CsgG [Lentimonas sp.]|jgi:curli biogenesis system outer membrane secretion channel CsgG